MNASDSAALKSRLLALLEELARDAERGLAASKVVELDQQAVGRLSRMDALQSQAMAKAQIIRRGNEERRIRATLARLKDGEYGFCSDCGDVLEAERLRVDPCLPRCLSCVRG